jgi:hypothetical protein
MRIHLIARLRRASTKHGNSPVNFRRARAAGLYRVHSRGRLVG